MPTPMREEEQEGVSLLVRTTQELFEHPRVAAASPEDPHAGTHAGEHLGACWGLAWSYLQRNPSRPVPTRSLASKVSYAAQRAADQLDSLPTRLRHGRIKLPFAGAATPSKTAELLRELVARMKDFRK